MSDIQMKYKELNVLKERSEGKVRKFEDENKMMTNILETEKKTKWEIEKDKVRLEKRSQRCQ